MLDIKLWKSKKKNNIKMDLKTHRNLKGGFRYPRLFII